MTASITIEGTVERLFKNDGNHKLIITVEDGGQYPTRVTVFVDEHSDVQQGDTVIVTSSRLPYIKERTYTDRDGVVKMAKDLILPSAQLGTTETPHGETYTGDIPF